MRLRSNQNKSSLKNDDMQTTSITNKSIEKFWLQDWSVLFRNYTILPECGMQNAERLNAMTRLIFVIAIILAIIGVGSWLLFLILGLVLVVILWYSCERKSKIENYRCRSHTSRLSGNSRGRKIRICSR